MTLHHKNLKQRGDHLKEKKKPFRARILASGFIKAESAVIGLLNGCMGMLMSMMTKLFCGAVSLTHMYLSDSMVTCIAAKPKLECNNPSEEDMRRGGIGRGVGLSLLTVRASRMAMGALAEAMVIGSGASGEDRKNPRGHSSGAKAKTKRKEEEEEVTAGKVISINKVQLKMVKKIKGKDKKPMT
ncbi:hypothetical protein BHE74_00031459 [Ensete ventricosum]|nr:hypothetical protein GW17_00032200 [Ensete ventricosum]RWW61498.1 hypothetical protein BHE74_00031459 [Ensete ventricosum]